MQKAEWKMSKSRKQWSKWEPVMTDSNHMNVDPALWSSCESSQEENTSQPKTESSFWMNSWLFPDSELVLFCPWKLHFTDFFFFLVSQLKNLQPLFVPTVESQLFTKLVQLNINYKAAGHKTNYLHLCLIVIEKCLILQKW